MPSTDRRQGLSASAAIKVPCRAATTANITLSGEQTIDGVACVADDRILVKNQTDGSENGIYECSSSAWSRAPDWDGFYDVKQGTTVNVIGGTQQGWWAVTTADTITVGTTSVSFSLTIGSGIPVTSQTYTGDGSTVAYTISAATQGANSLVVSVDGLLQEPTDAYTASGTTVTFTAAPPLNSEIVIRNWGYAQAVLEADSGSVSFTQSGTGATASTVEAKLQESVSVKDFGAVGDGVTDDTSAIQLALDSGVKYIKLPAGTYKTTSALDIPDGMFLIGDHPFTTIIEATGITGSAIKVNGTTSPDDSFEHVYLHGFTLDGNASSANAGDSGIDIFKTTRTKLSWLIIKDFGDHGLYFRGRNFHAEIDTVDCAGNFGYNAYVDWDSTSRNNAFVWKNWRTYASARGSAGNNLYLNQCNTHKFINCNIEDLNCTGYQIYMGDNVHLIDFDTLYSENNTRTGNHIYIDGASSSCSQISFNNSTISSDSASANTLVSINNASNIELNSSRFSQTDSSATSSFECIATSANSSLVFDDGNTFVLGGSAVNRNINSSTITTGNYRINGENYNNRLLITAKTSGDTLTTDDIGEVFTNESAAAIIETQLPSAGTTTRGAVFKFIRNNGTYAYQIQPSSGQNIRGGGTDKYLSLDSNGASVTLINTSSTTWDILSSNGTTSFEP